MTETKPEVKSKFGVQSTNILLNENSRINSLFLRETAKLIDQPGEATTSELSQCFKDHAFFLSVHKRVINEKQVKDDIEMLGGRLESFFGQDVTCLLTDEPIFPGNNKNNDKTDKPSISNPSSMLISARSRKLATLAPNLKKNCPKTSVINIFNNAKLWDQAIWKIDYFIPFVKQIVAKIKSYSKPSTSKTKIAIKSRSPRHVKPGVMSEKTKVMYLQKYFVKVESAKRNKFPLYKNLPFYPNIEISTATKNGSPFNDKFEKLEKMNKDKASTKPSFLQTSSGEIISRAKTSNTVTKTKKRKIGNRFYCQCCNTNFSSYERHTNGPRHQAFVKKKENFQCVYDVLKEYNIKSELKHNSIKIQDDSSNGYYSDESLTEEVNRKRPPKVLSSLSSDASIPVITRYQAHCVRNSSNCDLNFDCHNNFNQNPVETGTAVNYSIDSNRFDAKLTIIENISSKCGTEADLNCNLNGPGQTNSAYVGNNNYLEDANIHKSYLTNLEKNNLTNIHDAFQTNIAEEYQTNIAEAYQTNNAEEYQANIAEACQTNITEAYQTNIADAYHTNIADAYHTNIADAYQTNNVEAYQTNIAEVYQTNIAETYQKNNLEAYQKNNAEAYQKNNAEAYQKNNAEAYQKNNAEAYQKNNAEAYQTNNAEAYQTNIAEAYQTNIAEAYQTNIAEAYQTNITEAYQTNIAEAYRTYFTEAYRTNIAEGYQTNIEEGYQTNMEEAYPPNVQEAYPTNIQEVSNTNFQEGCSSNIAEMYLTNLDDPYPKISDQSFEKKVETNIPIKDVQEPNLDNVLEQFLKRDDQDGDRVSEMLKILKESVVKTNLESTKVSDNAEPLSLRFDDPLPTLPYKNNHGDSFCSEDSNDSLSRLNIDQVVNRVLEDNHFAED